MNDNVCSFVNLNLPKMIWQWDVFGKNLMTVHLHFEVPLWRRLLTRVFLGSVWTRLE